MIHPDMNERIEEGNNITLLGTNISPSSLHFWVDDVPFPQAGYVGSMEGSHMFCVDFCWIWKPKPW